MGIKKGGHMKKLLMILPMTLILCFMVGCQDKEAMAELEEFKAQATVEEANIALVKHLIEELNKGNPEIIEEVYAPDVVFYSPSSSPKPLSRDELIEFAKTNFKAVPDLNYGVEEIFSSGDKVIVRFIITGTHEGEFQGIPATGNQVKLSSIIIYSLKDEKIVEEREDADWLGLMQQLGMELKPKEGEK
jgi:steroid delta-isomerase-like uncharacterized protein